MWPPTSMPQPDLGPLWATETTVLEALMYRNKNQHGRAGYWKRLQVRGCFFREPMNR